MDIRTAKRAEEKLNDLHNNPAKRGWVKEPGDWPGPSWRFYFLQDASLLAMDRVPQEGGGGLTGAMAGFADGRRDAVFGPRPVR